MGLIVSIIDAIRRIGSPWQKSALRRQDAYLSNKSVLSRRVEINRSSSGPSQTFVATIDQAPEMVRAFNEAELLAIHENEAQVSVLSRRYLGKELSNPGPAELDAIFSAWAHSPERDATPEEAIVQILGAAFGQHCAAALDMAWVIVTDQDGSAAAIRGVRADFRAFPFHSIWKRIADNEHEFFARIFSTLRSHGEESREPRLSPNTSLERTRGQ